MNPVDVTIGHSPLILGMPHGGSFLPADIAAGLNDNGRILADTDWHIARLFDGLLPGATSVRANFHRYLIDANRDPSGVSLYPGQNTTGLCPITDFDGRAIWQPGGSPTDAQITDRIADWHHPYHTALQAQIERTLSEHGVAILFDCHSIRSHIPFLFPGTLPSLNIGTNSGTACAPLIETKVAQICTHSPYTTVLNGRFKGGWTTRHYGQPARNVHAIQLEIAQSAYLATEAAPFVFDAARAEKLRHTLSEILFALDALVVSGDLS